MAHGTTAWSNSVAGKVGHAGEIDKLLALEPGATLESISTWADEHRNPATAAWHYINFPKGTCSYAAARDFPDGNCVVAAIDKQLARSWDPTHRPTSA